LLWTGDGSASRSITGLGFQADMMWSKIRTDVHQHNLVDRVRGVDQRLLMPNSTGAEDTTCTHGWFDSLDSDGWSMTYAGGGWNVNTNSEDYVGWAWKAGGAAVSNTDGDDDTMGVMVSANTAAGFSIVKYTGTGSTATIGHGLAEAPNYISVKNRTDTYNWFMGSGLLTNDWSDWMHWNKTDGDGTNSTDTWNGQAPSPTVFTVDSTANSNGTGKEYVAYCWHSVEGYSKVGSFEGNYNVDGVFIYLGFKPAFFMWKRAAGSGGDDGGWVMKDNKRPPYGNVVDDQVYANSTGAEDTGNNIDFVSNGVKMRSIEMQGTSTTYVYLAFAESPFKYSNAR